ncbi:MAG: iron ABC transporter permease [Spirochaetes bacterium]|nr:iron ABC transporter permease [Spirochaetota bacterium]
MSGFQWSRDKSEPVSRQTSAIKKNKNRGGIPYVRGGTYWLLLLPILFLSMFFFFPLFSILVEGLTAEGGRLTLVHLLSVVTDTYSLRVIGFTAWQAVVSTLTSILLGLPGAYILARFDFRGKSLIKALTTVPFVLPSIIVVLGFVIFFGNNGFLNRAIMAVAKIDEPPLKILYSMRAIILAHTFYNFPICIRLVSSIWSRINPNLERAARSLGARGLTLFTRVTLPQLLPGILAAAALIFIFCFTSFAIILVLGGGPKYTTIEVAIYHFAKVNLDLKSASAFAVIESILSMGFMWGYIKLQQKASFAEGSGREQERIPLSALFKGPWGVLAVLYLIVAFLVIVAPMLTAAGNSFLRRSGWAGNTAFSFFWYKMLFFETKTSAFSVSYLTAIKNSLFFGLVTVLFSLPLGTLIAYVTTKRRFFGQGLFEAVAMLPLGISAIILGLGYIRAYQHLPWDITGKWYAIAFAHTIIAYPFVIRSTSAVFRKIDPSLLRAAMSLGANRLKAFLTVELPLIKSGLIAGATFAFAISIGEINATLMLYNPNLVTIPIAIYRLIGAYNYFAACALGTILMLICFAVFLLIDKLGFEVT